MHDVDEVEGKVHAGRNEEHDRAREPGMSRARLRPSASGRSDRSRSDMPLGEDTDTAVLTIR